MKAGLSILFVIFSIQYIHGAVVIQSTADITVPIPEDASISLNCSFDGNTAGATYKWQKDSTELAGETNEVFNKPVVKTGDTGNYTCSVTPSGSPTQTSPPVFIRIYKLSAVVASPSNTDVYEGDNVTITCSTTDAVPPITNWALIYATNNSELQSGSSNTFTLSFATVLEHSLTCTATNEYGIIKTSAPVTINVTSVADVPTVIFQNGDSINSGTAQSVTCQTEIKKSNPTTIFEHFKNDVKINGATSEIYSISSAQTSDAGVYKCLVKTNGITKTSLGKSLSVNLIAQISATPVSENDNGTFRCIVDGNETISSVEWFFDSTRQQTTSAELILSKLTRADNAKTVTCKTTSQATSVASNLAQSTVTVHWLDQPVIKPDGVVVVVEGKPYSLSCQVSSSNPSVSSYQWFKDGSSSVNTQNITVSSAVRSEKGQYQCEASTAGKSSRSAVADLIIEFVEKPTITGSDNKLVAAEGNSYSLLCDVTSSNDSLLTYKWSRDGVVLSNTTKVLQFGSVKQSDAGDYVCEASLSIASQNSSVAKLTVLYIDYVNLTINNASMTPVRVNFTDNRDLSLFCEAPSVTPSSALAYEIQSNRGGSFSNVTNEQAYVESPARIADSGVYKCIVTATLNGVSTSRSKSIEFIVQYAPPEVPTLSPSNSVKKMKEGTDHSVVCFVQTANLGFPAGIIEWFKGSNTIGIPNLNSTTQPGKNLVLQLTSVTKETTDNYTCRISNAVGSKSVTFEFITIIRPSVPRNFDAVSTERTITLTWSPPLDDGNDAIVDYTVRFGINANTLTTRNNIVPLTYTISNLEPAIRYHVEVSANTATFPVNNTAAKLNVTTGESVPSQPQSFIATTNNVQGKLFLSWQIPESPNGAVIGYRLCYYLSTNVGTPQICINLTSVTFSHTLDNLEHYAPYYLSIEAQTSRGFGAKAQLFSVLTEVSTPEKVRNADTKSSVTSSTISVNWDAPADLNGPSAKYNVKFGLNPGNAFIFGCRDIVTTSCLIQTNVLPAKVYRIVIIVNNTVFTSENIITKTTLKASPPKFVGVLPSPNAATIGTKTFSISLVSFSQENGEIIFHEVIVRPLPNTNRPTNDPGSYTTADINNGVDGIYVALRRSGAPNQNNQVTIGDLSNKRKKRALPTTVSNKELSPDTAYTVFIRVYATVDLHQSTNWYDVVVTKQEEDDGGGLSGGAIAGILIPIILIIILVIVALIWWQRKHPANNMGTKFGLKSQKQSHASISSPGIDNSFLPVPVNRFEDHVMQLSANGKYGFSQEYSSISRDLRFPYSASRLQENNIKNRYHNVPAYDSTRVVLAIQDNDPSTDYINANYIEGYENRNEYIATQGPLPETVFDFWRMIWEVESITIVMLTKLEEKGRAKCAPYWPESGSLSLKDFVITATEIHDFPDHIVRTFHITRTGQAVERIVKQFHFTAWPDFGVPDDPSSLLAFIRKVNNWKHLDKRLLKPTIIHCSAGVGRTGTYITIDTQIKNIKQKNDINAYGNVSAIREQRCLMVQTEDQYIFIHNAILDYLESGDTEVDASELREYIKNQSQVDPKIGITGIMEEFIRLAKTDKKDKFFEANKNCNQVKNRYKNVYPYDDTRVRLSPRPGVEGSDYINANYVDSYMSKDHFIATQAPLEGTVGDFWRMMWEQNCGTIVMLSKEYEGGQHKVYPYWPEKKSSKVECYIIELTSVTNHSDFIVRDMKLTNTETSSSRDLKQFQYTTWPETSSPEYGYGIIELIGHVQKWNSAINNRIITVHCSAGVGRTGVFIALTNLIERVKTENVVDVYQTIKKMRQQRTAMVQTRDQYEFCYRALQEYLDSFDLYANFR